MFGDGRWGDKPRRFDGHQLDDAWKLRGSLNDEICETPLAVAARGAFRRDARRGFAA